MRTETLITDRGVRLRARVPESHRERARGLLGRDALEPGGALLLERARSVHTLGMRFELKVALLDAQFHVLRVIGVPPGRVLAPRRGTRHVLEMRHDADVRVGDRVIRLRPARGSAL